jgi:hypothetical protein
MAASLSLPTRATHLIQQVHFAPRPVPRAALVPLALGLFSLALWLAGHLTAHATPAQTPALPAPSLTNTAGQGGGIPFIGDPIHDLTVWYSNMVSDACRADLGNLKGNFLTPLDPMSDTIVTDLYGRILLLTIPLITLGGLILGYLIMVSRTTGESTYTVRAVTPRFVVGATLSVLGIFLVSTLAQFVAATDLAMVQVSIPGNAVGGPDAWPASGGVFQVLQIPPVNLDLLRADELARYPRLCEAADGVGLREIFGREPVAEHVQAADVARDAHRGEGGAKLHEPGTPGRRVDLVEDRVGAEASDRPAQDVAIPARRSRRPPFGDLRVEEQFDRSPDLECHRRLWSTDRATSQIPVPTGASIRCPLNWCRDIRCPRIEGVRCSPHSLASMGVAHEVVSHTRSSG